MLILHLTYLKVHHSFSKKNGYLSIIFTENVFENVFDLHFFSLFLLKKMKPTITLKDLARKLNLSVSTVSKALKDYQDISFETRQRVKALAEELNFTPNTQAINFRKKQTKIIGVIIPNIVHHFFSQVVSGIMTEAKKHNYMTLLFQSDEDFSIEESQLNLLKDYSVDGVVMSLSNTTVHSEHIRKIQEADVPIVLFDKIDDTINCSKVVIDDFNAAIQATEHLIEQKRKRIGYIGGPEAPKNYSDRFNGYRTALLKNDLDYEEGLVIKCPNVSHEASYENALRMIKKAKPDAIFCATDLLAIGAMKAIKEIGLKIPYHIALVGFSDWFISSVVSPSLTTVRQPGFIMGQQCFSLLYKEMQAKQLKSDFVKRKIVLPTELVIRESSVLQTL